MSSYIQLLSTISVDSKYGLPDEGTFLQKSDINNLGSYAFLNEESIPEFLCEIE